VEAQVLVGEPEPDAKIVLKKILPFNREGKFVFTTQEGGEHKVSLLNVVKIVLELFCLLFC
jgi:hypothetical protein